MTLDVALLIGFSFCRCHFMLCGGRFWHYGNLGLLASAICTIFFILTDRSALLFLGAFQLKVCWAILVGTLALMGCVIYDLNTPLSVSRYVQEKQ
jgi:hypothetical protein